MATDKDHIKEITECADQIYLNACKARLEWSSGAPNRDERGRILMELRHDLKDAFEAVEALEEIEEAATV